MLLKLPTPSTPFELSTLMDALLLLMDALLLLLSMEAMLSVVSAEVNHIPTRVAADKSNDIAN